MAIGINRHSLQGQPVISGTPACGPMNVPAVAPSMAAPGDNRQGVERLEADLLLEGLYQLHGADFRGYARAPLMQRLHAYMHGSGIDSISLLQDCIMRSRPQADALVRALSLRPAALFGDTDSVLHLRATLGPYLRSCALPKLWIAESTSAEEVFGLVILLIEEGLYDKTLIFVTAADDALLAETRMGTFDVADMARYDDNYRRSGGRHALSDYCSNVEGRMVFAPHLRNNLIWAQYDLATDRSFNEFQLILCRRVLPEFGPPLRRRALHLFADSLSSFGILAVDVPDELDHAPMAFQFQTVSREHGLYRRIG